MPFVFLLALMICGRNAQAEYRLYRLKISDTKTNASRMVTTTLDNVQYRGYFPIRQNELVTIEAHWMCWDLPGEARPRLYCPQPPPPPPKNQTAPTSGRPA